MSQLRGGRTCEDYDAIDVRRWHREGFLKESRPEWWVEPSIDISVCSESDAVVRFFRGRSPGARECESIRQRVPITWTPCHLGGQRPWFRCCGCIGGQYCRRRVAKLYRAGDFFACRRCHGLAYASQSQPMRHRVIAKAQKIRMRLGGSRSGLGKFPEKPKGMHWRTFERLRRSHDEAQARSMTDTSQYLDRLRRRCE
jgi:hypothetical protein